MLEILIRKQHMQRVLHIVAALFFFLLAGSGARTYAQQDDYEYPTEISSENAYDDAAEPDAPWYDDLELAPRTFDDGDWEGVHKALDYSGEPPAEKVKKEKTETPPREPWDPFENWPDLSIFFKVLFIILLVVLVGFILYRVVEMPDNTKIAPATDGFGPDDYADLERLEAALDDMDVLPFLEKAEQDGNYPLAVRLQFLALLKTLNEAGYIQWKKDHTNRVYVNQMRGQSGFPVFQSLTRTFERVWYGNQHPDAAEYQRIKAQFTDFIQQRKAPIA